ncbi:MAG: proline--tRNA ligase, partial [Sphingomonadales bacterium]|nr:proline--tRNA ligase [Sphingomonadales bacterium]
HEFTVLAETGESEVYYHKDFEALDPMIDVDYTKDLQPTIDQWTANYAATDEKHDANSDIDSADLITGRGIEVGHIFYFGTKYSDAMGATVQGPNDDTIAVEMGSYGIGVSRLVGAIIEASHDDKGIVWPESVAPFKVGIINIRADDDACVEAADTLYKQMEEAGVEALYDDRADRAGVKFSTMELIGLPWFITIGPRGVKNNLVELVNRKTGEKVEVSPEEALKRMIG